MSETVEIKVYKTQVRSGDADAKERGIRDKADAGDSGDWRDPDVVIPLNGFVVQSGDDAYRAHRGAVVPDWEKGWSVVDNAHFAREVFSGRGEPPTWVATALREGKVICGIIILRDDQRHN